MVDHTESRAKDYLDPSKVPIRVLLGSLTVPQIWAIGSGLAFMVSAVVAIAYALGQRVSDTDHRAQVQELERQLVQANGSIEDSERKHQKEATELQALLRKTQDQNIDRYSVIPEKVDPKPFITSESGKWIGANGQACNVVCGKKQLHPVSLGSPGGSVESHVCAGAAPGDTGKRGGHVTVGGSNCSIGGGSPSLFATSYSCLCTNSEISPP